MIVCWIVGATLLLLPDGRERETWAQRAAKLADAVGAGAGVAAFSLVRENEVDVVEESLESLVEASNGEDKTNATEALDAYRRVVNLMKTYPVRQSGGYAMVKEGRKCTESLDKIDGQRAKRLWFLVACLRVATANEFCRIEYDDKRAIPRRISVVLDAHAQFCKWRRKWVRPHLIYYVKDDSHWRGERLEWRGKKQDRPKHYREIIEYIDLVEPKINMLDKAFPTKWAAFLLSRSSRSAPRLQIRSREPRLEAIGNSRIHDRRIRAESH